MSIQPKWCELIASGKKTVEVRKTRPKLEAPFKCYIYETKAKDHYAVFHENTIGKVIGEFVCDKIFDICIEISSPDYLPDYPFPCTGLTDKEIMQYLGNGKTGYAWHISDLVIYDKPKRLSEFYRPCIDEEYHYCPCCKYGHEIFSPDEVECSADVPGACYEQICLNRVKRPPQSWCYVEELSI